MLKCCPTLGQACAYRIIVEVIRNSLKIKVEWEILKRILFGILKTGKIWRRGLKLLVEIANIAVESKRPGPHQSLRNLTIPIIGFDIMAYKFELRHWLLWKLCQFFIPFCYSYYFTKHGSVLPIPLQPLGSLFYFLGYLFGKIVQRVIWMEKIYKKIFNSIRMFTSKSQNLLEVLEILWP